MFNLELKNIVHLTFVMLNFLIKFINFWKRQKSFSEWVPFESAVFHMNFPATIKLWRILWYLPSLRVALMTFGACFLNWIDFIKMASTYHWENDLEQQNLFVRSASGLTSGEEFGKIVWNCMRNYQIHLRNFLFPWKCVPCLYTCWYLLAFKNLWIWKHL